MARTRRVESEREREKLVDEYMTRGYKVKQQGQYSARVKEKDWGSAPVHGFVFLFSLLGAALLFDAVNASAGGAWVLAFLASGTYAAYSWFTAEEILIKVDEDSEPTGEDEPENESRLDENEPESESQSADESEPESQPEDRNEPSEDGESNDGSDMLAE